jgi:hypothetical protein
MRAQSTKDLHENWGKRYTVSPNCTGSARIAKAASRCSYRKPLINSYLYKGVCVRTGEAFSSSAK